MGEAAADAAQLRGEGIARQRRAIIDGLRDSITHGSDETLSTEKISELLLITQYFETLRDVAANSKAQTVFLPHSAGAVADGEPDSQWHPSGGCSGSDAHVTWAWCLVGLVSKARRPLHASSNWVDESVY